MKRSLAELADMTPQERGVSYHGTRPVKLVDGHQSSDPLVMRRMPGTPDVELTARASQAIRNHSPDGFEWGYGGSGPAQLALALCLDVLNGDRQRAESVYQAFKFAYVATWEADWSILAATIEEFIVHLEAERADAQARRETIEADRPAPERLQGYDSWKLDTPW